MRNSRRNNISNMHLIGNAPQLGFGVLRLPRLSDDIDWGKTEKIIQEYMKGQFRYFDIHPSYLEGKAQMLIKKLVVERYPRKDYLIANKMPYYDIKSYKDYEDIYSQELRECGVDYFDYYMLHCLMDENYDLHEKIGGFDFLEDVKKKGKAKKIGFSFHGSPQLLNRILKKHTEVDFVQLQINFFDWESPVICSRENYEIARKFQKEILVMEVVKGGSLSNPMKVNGTTIHSAELAKISLLFAAKLPGINIILSGFSEIEHVKENRMTLENSVFGYDENIYAQLREQLRKNSKIRCTGCQYCMRECPKGIAIPDIITLLNSCRNVGPNDRTFVGRYKKYYNNLARYGETAGACLGCGACEKKCPQKVGIRQVMKEAKLLFEESEKEEHFYTNERNAQILIHLMKAHGIKKVVASPGAINMCVVYSVQQDNFFEVYSAPDERSAAYIACGLAEESGEPVALSCTGATASRNYLPGLTEGFYRKLPLVTITSSRPLSQIGHNLPQVIDRTNPLNDIARISVNVHVVKDWEDEWNCEIQINKALLELKHNGCGPVHINLETTHSSDFSVRRLPEARVIRRIHEKNSLPDLKFERIAIFCGAHSKWTDGLTNAVDQFCNRYNALVIHDHTSNYKGRYGVQANLITDQDAGVKNGMNEFDLIIHIGNISGAYMNVVGRHIWRVNPDGEIVDTFRKLKYVFEMEEDIFFRSYLELDALVGGETSFVKEWESEYNRLLKKIPELPFSNAWAAKQTAGRLPAHSILHLGILNSLRNWNFFKVPDTVLVYANTGGFGIDGCVSTLLGASLANPDKLYFGVVGDLAFFYDMNALGNRYVGSNLRLIVINNGGGAEFKNYNHVQAMFRNEADPFMAAMGHYGKKSTQLIKNYSEALGFEYFGVTTKEKYLQILPKLLSEQITERPILVELFTDAANESEALRIIRSLDGEAKRQSNRAPIHTYEPKRLVETKSKKSIILWGTGGCFHKNLAKIRQYCSPELVCDNNPSKWGKEIVPEIVCVSPIELSGRKDIFVIIMIDDAAAAFSVANQLLDLDIKEFDLIYNWLGYAGHFANNLLKAGEPR